MSRSFTEHQSRQERIPKLYGMEFDKADGDGDHDGTLDVSELGRLRVKLAGGLKR